MQTPTPTWNRRTAFGLAATLTALLAITACGGSEAPVEEAAAPEITEILIPGERIFPESITSTADGTIIIGSLALGSIYRAAPGQATAEQWVAPGTAGLGAVLGVFADEASNTLWVCSNNLDGSAPEPTALKALDLTTAGLKGTYPLPGENPLCNDIAVAPSGAAYIADTRGEKVFMLKPGADALEMASDDPLLTGADGLAFGAQPGVLYVNSVSAGKLLRLDLDDGGMATAVTELTPSRALEQPDGMRSIGPDRLLLAEGAGRMSVVNIAGDNASVETLMERSVNTPAVTATRGMAWVVEGKLDLRNDPDSQPGEFKLFSAPLP